MIKSASTTFVESLISAQGHELMSQDPRFDSVLSAGPQVENRCDLRGRVKP